ncbi:hypothetical protein B0H14DRAFT_2564977 [Mycena olivaceomarginata]|nr:hypothetical protein B0H14DRAFT_2564977 [Mycena olivaceomarginata]
MQKPQWMREGACKKEVVKACLDHGSEKKNREFKTKAETPIYQGWVVTRQVGIKQGRELASTELHSTVVNDRWNGKGTEAEGRQLGQFGDRNIRVDKQARTAYAKVTRALNHAVVTEFLSHIFLDEQTMDFQPMLIIICPIIVFWFSRQMADSGPGSFRRRNDPVLIHSFPTREDPPSVSPHLPLVPHSLPPSTTILHRPHLPIPSVHGFMAKVEAGKGLQHPGIPRVYQPEPTNNPRKAWFEMIVRKFTNYRNCVYCKSATCDTNLSSRQREGEPVAQIFPLSQVDAGITVAPPSIVKHNNSPPPQLSTIQPPKSESGPTGPLDIGHEQKIVNPELSENPSPVFGSYPLEHSTPGAAVKRKAKKQLEGTEEHRKQYAKKPKLRLYRASSLEYCFTFSRALAHYKRLNNHRLRQIICVTNFLVFPIWASSYRKTIAQAARMKAAESIPLHHRTRSLYTFGPDNIALSALSDPWKIQPPATQVVNHRSLLAQVTEKYKELQIARSENERNTIRISEQQDQLAKSLLSQAKEKDDELQILRLENEEYREQPSQRTLFIEQERAQNFMDELLNLEADEYGPQLNTISDRDVFGSAANETDSDRDQLGEPDSTESLTTSKSGGIDRAIY